MYRFQDFRAEMARKGYTIKQLAGITGITHHVINDIRMGRPVNIEDLAKVAIALEMNWESIFKGIVPDLATYREEVERRRHHRHYQFQEASLFAEELAA